ncbi:MAG: hypothetical protein EA369_01115 [Bradymonadales bacterium]|nr:MAG: hypothetical protein EA369_01115 [Bradymonadales bacterium]
MRPGARVYLIAVCGTGMSALAGLLKERGCVVAGSDINSYSPVKELLEELQVPVKLEYDVKDLQKFQPDYVVIGNFVRADNPQAQFVLKTGIPYGSLPSCLEDFFLQETENLVVVGTHGKSTTATCLAFLLNELELSPSFFIGAVAKNFRRSFQVGEGRHFVLEGDEYDTAFFDKESKFLHYRPKVGIWTSLEFDHADIFSSMDRIEQMFLKFVELIPSDGRLIYCRDSERIHELVEGSAPSVPTWSYGFHPGADFCLRSFEQSAEGMSFVLGDQSFSSSQMGSFNALNFSAALLAAHSTGLSFESLSQALKRFEGLKRRQERVYQTSKVEVIDDFAHHPTAVREVIQGFRLRSPEAKIMVYFEPRSNTTRRAIFQTEFVRAFEKADFVFLPEVFRKEVLDPEDCLDVPRLVSDLKLSGRQAYGPMTKAEMLEETKRQILKLQDPIIILVLSNGSFDGLTKDLISLTMKS